ncbi:MAG TPA: OsmC family protein [Candidatus Kapabacteria bacterium]|nr:OsmC family protein [Candidatus Kapabacteria bacterium]
MAQISAFLESGTRVRITNGRHEWLADEPLDAEGTDMGPMPYELLLGSLAACTAITLRLYAQHKGIEIPWMRLSYEHDYIESDGADGGRSGRFERITAHVTIGGDYDDAQRARLTQIVGRCKVHKTLTESVEIIDEVVFADLAETVA